MELDLFVRSLFKKANEAGFSEYEVYYVDRESLSISVYKSEVEKYNVNNSAGLSFRGKLGDRIGYLHLHNNHGKQYIQDFNNDEHLGITNGTIDIKQVLSLLEKYAPNSIWSIEAKTKYLEESITSLQEFGYIKDE